MSQELRSHETIARQQMEKLASSGFLKKKEDNQFVYDPTLEMHSKVELLNQTYKEMSVAVIGFIYEKPTDKLKALADAFKFKKD
jgi:O-acetylhomoserine/O-acetylserine sulfhydrylase-like pyridoxal-dependent enzyme